jgi:hypothetical protein
MPERVVMRVGEAREIALSSEADLVVSRRGVVDLQHMSGGRWRLTGMRRGFVSVRTQRDEMPSAARFFVEVLDKEADAPVGSGGKLVWPAWLCGANSLVCDSDKGVIDGEAPSLAWLDQAREYCRTHACWVKAEMGESAWRRVNAQYRVRAKAFLLDEGDVEKLGINHDWSVETDWKGTLTRQILSRLEALLRKNQRKIVGEPTLRLRAGVPVKAMAGGEIAVQRRPGGAEEWKAFGLDVTLTVEPRGEGNVLLRYELALHHRMDGGDGKVMSRHGLSGEAVIGMGAPTILGNVDYTVTAESREGIPVLSSIPLIGVFFRMSGDESVRNQLYLMAQVVADEGQGLEEGLASMESGK